MKLALEYYEEGGDSYYECWNKTQFQEYQHKFGPITKEEALEMFNFMKAVEDDEMGW